MNYLYWILFQFQFHNKDLISKQHKSINLFHLVCSFRSRCLIIFFEVGEFFLNFIIINAQTKFDHSVNSGGKWWRLVKRKSRSKKSSVEQKPDKISDCLVTSVLIRLFLELSNNGVFGVDFHSFLWYHVVCCWWISKIRNKCT